MQVAGGAPAASVTQELLLPLFSLPDAVSGLGAATLGVYPRYLCLLGSPPSFLSSGDSMPFKQDAAT